MAAEPYTVWWYFPTEEEAAAAVRELCERGHVAAADPAPSARPGSEWLVRASTPRDWDVEPDEWWEPWEELAERHGGVCDGGETGWFDPETGRYR